MEGRHFDSQSTEKKDHSTWHQMAKSKSMYQKTPVVGDTLLGSASARSNSAGDETKGKSAKLGISGPLKESRREWGDAHAGFAPPHERERAGFAHVTQGAWERNRAWRICKQQLAPICRGTGSLTTCPRLRNAPV